MGNNLEKEFVSYEQALALKELGFDEPCVGRFFCTHFEIIDIWTNDDLKVDPDIFTSAPLKQQVFRWFREKYDYHHTIIHNKKYVGIAYSSVVNFSIDQFNTYEEAENACIDQLILIAKQQDK